MSKSTVIMVERSVLRSKAFKELQGAPKYIYFQFLCKRIFVKNPRNSRENYRCVNERELVFTYEEAYEKHGFTATKFTRSVDKLIEFGFIDIVEYGGHAKGRYSVYGLSDRWKRFGKPDFIKEERSKLKTKPSLRGFTGKTDKN